MVLTLVYMRRELEYRDTYRDTVADRSEKRSWSIATRIATHIATLWLGLAGPDSVHS